MVRSAFVTALILASTAWESPAAATPAKAPAAANTRIMLFNLTPAGTYNVRRNGASAGAAVANPAGALVFESNATGGDRFEFMLPESIRSVRPGLAHLQPPATIRAVSRAAGTRRRRRTT